MIDFFDEDFPLTKKQAEEEKRRLEEEKNAQKATDSADNNEDDFHQQDSSAESSTIAESSADEDFIDETISETVDNSKDNDIFVPSDEEVKKNDDSIFNFSFPPPENAGEYEPERALAEIAETNNSISDSDTAVIQPLEEAESDIAVTQLTEEAAAESNISNITEDTYPNQENGLPWEQLTDEQSAAEIGATPNGQAVSEAEPDESEEVSEEPAKEAVTTDEAPENEPTENEDGEDIPSETEADCPASGITDTNPQTEDEATEILTGCDPENAAEPDLTVSKQTETDVAEANASPDMQEQENTDAAPETVCDTDSVEPLAEPKKSLSHSEISAEIEEAVSSAINLHIETFIRGFKPTEAEADRALREELSRLNKKLDNVEKAVGAVEVPMADESDSQDFTYEYDERYFAEEETPAYKYPGLYKRNPSRSKENTRTSAGRSAAKASKAQSFDKSNGNITVNTKTLLKMGAMVAATAAAVKLLGKKND